MRKPRKLTKNERIAVEASGYNSENWLHLEDVGKCYIRIIHKVLKTQKIINKEVKVI